MYERTINLIHHLKIITKQKTWKSHMKNLDIRTLSRFHTFLNPLKGQTISKLNSILEVGMVRGVNEPSRTEVWCCGMPYFCLCHFRFHFVSNFFDLLNESLFLVLCCQVFHPSLSGAYNNPSDRNMT